MFKTSFGGVRPASTSNFIRLIGQIFTCTKKIRQLTSAYFKGQFGCLLKIKQFEKFYIVLKTQIYHLEFEYFKNLTL